MNKTVVVTGASQGLGLSLVKEGIKRHYDVFALDIKNSDELNALERCHFILCDVTDYACILNCRRIIEKNCQSVDILFNNAGIWLDNERLTLDDPKFDFDIVKKQFDVNALGVVRMVRVFLSLIEKSETKAVINLSSEAASITDCRRKGEYGYCMSKAAQNMATKLMKNAYPNINFRSVHPGWMITPQGLLGSDGSNKPTQNPYETAAKLYELAESGDSEGSLFTDFKGTKLNC